ncbi:hypothetical protein SM12VA4_26170 [Serratia marcescens]|nr:hypothetical protein SM12VA4_26170 [Serratia marcescens]
MALHQKTEKLEKETPDVKKAAKKKAAKKTSIVAKEFKLF